MLIKVLKCYINTRQELEDMLYLFELQKCYYDNFVINDFTVKDEIYIFPSITYYVYIENGLCDKLCELPKFNEIYGYWHDDLYELDEMCGKDNRVWDIHTTFSIVENIDNENE